MAVQPYMPLFLIITITTTTTTTVTAAADGRQSWFVSVFTMQRWRVAGGRSVWTGLRGGRTVTCRDDRHQAV